MPLTKLHFLKKFLSKSKRWISLAPPPPAHLKGNALHVHSGLLNNSGSLFS